MLIGLTVALPSATPVTGSRPGVWSGKPSRSWLASSWGRPMSAIAWRIFSGPLSMPSVMSMNAVLMESSVALIMLTAPKLSLPWFSTSPPSGRRYGEFPSKVSLRE